MKRVGRCVVVIVLTLTVLAAWASYSLGGCTMMIMYCYSVIPGCPDSTINNCYQSQQYPGEWFRVDHTYTYYFCGVSSNYSYDCALDTANWNNVCADITFYANQQDCNNQANSIGTGHIYTKALCGGSNPCGS